MNITIIIISGIGNEYSNLLEQAGVSSIQQLALQSAESLYNELILINKNKKLVKRNPSVLMLKEWIRQADLRIKRIEEKLDRIDKNEQDILKGVNELKTKIVNYYQLSQNDKFELLTNLNNNNYILKDIDKKIDITLPQIKREIKKWIKSIEKNQNIDKNEKNYFIKELKEVIKIESTSKIIASIPLIPGFLKLQHEFKFNIDWMNWFKKLREVFKKSI